MARSATVVLVASVLGMGCGLVLDLDPDPAPSGIDGAVVESDGGPRVRDAARPTDAGRMRADAAVAVDAGGTGVADGSSPPVLDARAVDALFRLPVGAACGVDSECASGYCYDVALSNPFCSGTVCTIPCSSDSECDAYGAAAGAMATGARCVRHTAGDEYVCDFSWISLPGAAIGCT